MGARTLAEKCRPASNERNFAVFAGNAVGSSLVLRGH